MKKILIIDDEFIFRQGLRYMMNWEACGYTIAGEASNGQEGLSLCRELHPDIVLCDVVMPILNGVEFVREIQSEHGPAVIMLSNFDEYGKVRKAFQYGAADYLLKSQISREELLACLERTVSCGTVSVTASAEKTFGVLLRQALDGYAPEPFAELQEYLDNRLAASSYILLYLDTLQPDFKTEAHLEDTIRTLLPHSKDSKDSLSVCAASTTRHHAVCLIGLSDTLRRNRMDSFMEQLSLRILHTSCAVSLPFPGLSCLRTKVERLMELCSYSVLYEEKLCFLETELLAEWPEPPSFLADRYFSYLHTGQIAAACQMLLSYLDTLKNTAAMEPYRFRKFLEHTFYDSLRELRKSTEHTQALNKIELKLFKQLDQALHFVQIRDCLAGAYAELASLCTAPRKDDTVIKEMTAYLETHFSRQITLYDLAEHLHMNYSYLSAFISQNTGRHFSEHLNETRIRHAKQLLAGTSHSISYISETIGYTDQSYFGKIFKKAVGMTPLQYRNHIGVR